MSTSVINLLNLANKFLQVDEDIDNALQCIERALKMQPKSREGLIYKGINIVGLAINSKKNYKNLT